MRRSLARLILAGVLLVIAGPARADSLVDDFSASPFTSGAWCEREHVVTWRSQDGWLAGSNADCCSGNEPGSTQCVPGSCVAFLGGTGACGGVCGVAGDADAIGCEHLLITTQDYAGEDRTVTAAFNVQQDLAFEPAVGCLEPVENVRVVAAAHPHCRARIEARVIRMDDQNPAGEYALEIRSVTEPLSGYPECDELDAQAQRINQPLESSPIDAAARFMVVPASTAPRYELSLHTTLSPSSPGTELRAVAEVVDRQSGEVVATASKADFFRPAWYAEPSQGRRIAVGGARDPLSAPHLLDDFEALTVVVPPDPSEPGIANGVPPVDPTAATTIKESTSFLYAPDDPTKPTLQTAFDDPNGYIDPRKIEVKRAAVIHGGVEDESGNPLAGVSIHVLEDQGYGRTHTRADGRFDIAVNGGSRLTLVYQRPGYLGAQRQVEVPWQDYVNAPDVVLVELDPIATEITLSALQEVTAHRASPTPDDDGPEGPAGPRQATLLFFPGTTATMSVPGVGDVPLDEITVRATEYTVGPDGPRRMPAELPPTSAYTYAVELSVDEAEAAGAMRVDFTNKPVVFYVENFLDFPFSVETGPEDSRPRTGASCAS